MCFRQRKYLYLDVKFIVCVKELNRQEVSIGLGHGLAPNRRQVIALINEHVVHKHKMCLCDLKKCKKGSYPIHISMGSARKM